MSYFNYKRRESSEAQIGSTPIGSTHPIRVQSMTNTNTNDTEASAAQVIRIVEAGADYVRLTAQGVREGENLKNIKELVRAQGHTTPLIADIHFNPRAAEAAARHVEKVRINPGNFVDRVKTFGNFEYTDEEYANEIQKIRDRLTPLLAICKENKTALRIGVNHGSLSDRIMSRYGDTPEGMVESCLEFLHICVDADFKDIVISMKTSNTLLMTKAVRLLIQRMDKENLKFPLHLGVTEAGDGEDGRIKSAVGIGALLSDGIGDTIRISLSEDPEYEIPVAKKLIAYINERTDHDKIDAEMSSRFDPLSFDRRKTYQIGNIGDTQLPVVIADRSQGNFEFDIHFLPDYIYVGNTLPTAAPRSISCIVDADAWRTEEENTYPLFDSSNWQRIATCQSAIKFLTLSYPQLSKEIISLLTQNQTIVILLATDHANGVGEQRAFMHTLLNNYCQTPVIINRKYKENLPEDIQVKAGTDFGAIYLDGFGDGIFMQNTGDITPKYIDAYMFGILQAARIRTSKTEYISCPSCGRTLFDLQTTVAKIKESTSHLRHLKIGVMGCIVNGPGEMADADYGYVGAEKGKISLYKKKELVEKNIPSEYAVDRLIDLIKIHNDWVEPDPQ